MNIDNVHRRYTDVVFRAFGRSGSYVEVGNVRGPDSSYLRMFCQNNIKEPLFAFIANYDLQRASIGPVETEAAGKAADYVRRVLGFLALDLDFGSGQPMLSSFQIHDIQVAH